VFYSNRNSETHGFELGVWDRHTDRQTDGQTEEQQLRLMLLNLMAGA